MNLPAVSRDVSRVAALAENPRGMGRADIYQAVASLYRLQGPQLSDRERALMRDILSRLASDVEMAIRVAAAERVADDPDAPLDLILLLVNDKIEIARPIVLRSQQLTDEELLKFIAEADIAHQALCAERPNISEAITDVLSRSEAEPVLIALTRNVTARIAEPTFARLVDKSRAICGLQEPLARRRDLPPSLAADMCEWVSDALKAHLEVSFHANRDVAAHAVAHAAAAIQESAAATPIENSRKLIEKLAVAGQLKPGFLLRVLQQGQLDLFELGFGRLLELDDKRLHRVLYENGPRPVAMACRAVGIDRCVFPTVYNLSRQGRHVAPLLCPEDRPDVEAVFNTYSRPEAFAWLHAC